MSRTKGALGRKTIERMKNDAAQPRDDSYIEAFTGIGSNRDRSSYARAKRGWLLDMQTVTDIFLSDGFGRKIVETPAEEMTRSGIYLEDLEDDELEKHVMAKLDELDAFKYYNDAVAWSRLFGGSLVVYGLNDGGALDTPLNPAGIKDVEFIRVYDRYEATVQERNNDPSSVDYGKPDLWLISPQSGGTPYKVHNSRVWRFDGESLPNQLRQQNEGWGASSLQQCCDQLKRFGMSHQWTLAMLERSQQAVHGIPNLGNTLRQPGGDAMVQKRVDVVDMVRGILNTVVTDAEESYDIKSTSMTGVPDIIDRFAEALAAVSGIPVTILMGRAQGGLSASDKASMDAWYARIEAMWNDILRKPEDRLVSWIIMAKQGQVPEYKLCMNPLTVLSDKEKAEVCKLEADARKADMETDVGYAGINAFDPVEIRKKRAELYGVDEDSAPPEAEPVEPVDGNYQ